MTDWTPRELELDLSFLGEGEYTAEIFEDGINADRNAQDYRRVETSLGDVKVPHYPFGTRRRLGRPHPVTAMIARMIL